MTTIGVMVIEVELVAMRPTRVGFPRPTENCRARSVLSPLLTFWTNVLWQILGCEHRSRVYAPSGTVDIPIVFGQLRLAGERCSGPW
jgi:hypothetical protein